jgi:DNA repair protein RadC
MEARQHMCRSGTAFFVEGEEAQVEEAQFAMLSNHSLECRDFERWQEAPAVDACSVGQLLAIILGREHMGTLSSLLDGDRGFAGIEPDESGRFDAGDSSLAVVSRAHPAQLEQTWRLRPDSALRLAACFALGRMVEQDRMPRRARLQSPSLVHQLMAPRLRGLPIETLHVLLLDGKHRLQRLLRVSEGTLTNAMVHPREVYAPALAERAAAVIAVHNHPSGDPEPSEDDLRVTRRLIETGSLLGVPLVDHVIVGEGGFVSLRERLRWEA